MDTNFNQGWILMTIPSELALSWDDIERDASRLAQQIAPLAPFKGILAITRGGLAPAQLLAYFLDIRTIDTLGIASYEDRQAGLPRVVKPAGSQIGTGHNWLVVDDLADSGATFAAARTLYPQAHFITLYVKPQGKAQADYYVAEVEQNTWLVFPWEKTSHLPAV
jgi:xanthine phosphoribosyltransferase